MGNVRTLVSDNETQFTSAEFEEFCKLCKITHIQTAPYHPQSNGEAERFVQTFKQSMSKAISSGKKEKEALRSFLIHYRITPHATTGFPPCELLMRRHLRTNLDLIKPGYPTPKGNHIEQKRTQQPEFRKEIRVFPVGSAVLVKNHGTGPKWIRGTVSEELGKLMYQVSTKYGLVRRHINQMRKDYWEPGHVAIDREPVAAPPVPDDPPAPIQRRYPERRHAPPQRFGL